MAERICSKVQHHQPPSAWRLVYTIESDEAKIVNIILEWFDHKEYEKRFHY